MPGGQFTRSEEGMDADRAVDRCLPRAPARRTDVVANLPSLLPSHWRAPEAIQRQGDEVAGNDRSAS